MSQVRVDPLTGLKAIIAAERADRPGAAFGVEPAEPIDPQTDPFAEGHEDRTPPEVAAERANGSVPDSPGWTVRAVPNLYPALSHESPEPAAEANPDLFHAQRATGAHEVIVNERVEAGASLPHTHAQLYALDFVPAAVARERERFGAYAVRTMGSNLLGDLVQEEVRRRERIVAIDDEAVLMCPYAPMAPYQLMLAPRRTRARFEDDGPSGAALLHDGLSRLKRLLGASPPLNLWVRTAPHGADSFCWRIDIVPRLGHFAGLELGTGVQLCVVSPERSAKELSET